jgi:hypothetical protein
MSTEGVRMTQANIYDEDEYWLECVRRSGSNSVVSGWADIAAFLASGRADDRALAGLQASLRSLSQWAGTQLSERREAARLARYGSAKPRDSE